MAVAEHDGGVVLWVRLTVFKELLDDCEHLSWRHHRRNRELLSLHLWARTSVGQDLDELTGFSLSNRPPKTRRPRQINHQVRSRLSALI